MGECDQATTESILDFYYDQVRKFIQTAESNDTNVYKGRLVILSRIIYYGS